MLVTYIKSGFTYIGNMLAELNTRLLKIELKTRLEGAAKITTEKGVDGRISMITWYREDGSIIAVSNMTPSVDAYTKEVFYTQTITHYNKIGVIIMTEQIVITENEDGLVTQTKTLNII